MKDHPSLVVRKKGYSHDIDEPIGLYCLFGDGMNFHQSIRSQSEGRWHYMSMACPSVAQNNRSWLASSDGKVATFVAAIVVFVLALQKSRKGHRPVDVMTLKLQFVRFDLQQKLILFHCHKICELLVTPSVGHLMTIWIYC